MQGQLLALAASIPLAPEPERRRPKGGAYQNPPPDQENVDMDTGLYGDFEKIGIDFLALEQTDEQ